MVLKLSLRSAFFLFLTLLSTHLFAITHTVAVMPFENVSKDSKMDWLSMGIPETVTNSLLAVKGLVLVERIQLRKVMDEQKLHLTGAIDEKTVVEVGKLIGASILVVGAFQKQDDVVRLTARFVDVRSGGVLQTAQATGKLTDIFNLQDKIVLHLVKNLNIELKQDELTSVAVRPTKSLEAYQYFGQGALLQAKKNYQGAVKEFQKASEIDPKFSLAKNKFVEAFLSLNRGNYWKYRGEVTGTVGSRTTQIHRASGLRDFNGKKCFTYTRDISGDVKSRQTEYYVKGEDGIYMVGIDSKVTGPRQRIIYKQPVLIYPYDLQVGKEWVSQNEYKVKSLLIFKSTMYENRKYAIDRKETIEIPSVGNVECFVIQNDSSFDGGIRIRQSHWFAPGIGIVKMTSQTDSKYLKSVSEHILTDYHVEE